MLATATVRLATLVTPVARRRVSKLAREVTTLDRLSAGRMVLGAGLGAPIADEFGSFGEPTGPRELADHLDEGLEALSLLWSGEPVTYHGRHVHVDDVTFLPTPVQRPRVPIWVAGVWPARRPMRRAARWDGAAPIMYTQDRKPLQPDAATVREIRAFLTACRAETVTGAATAAGAEALTPTTTAGPATGPFDLVMCAMSPASPAAAADLAGSLAEAGATWWAECMWGDDLEKAAPMIRRVEQGPPRG